MASAGPVDQARLTRHEVLAHAVAAIISLPDWAPRAFRRGAALVLALIVIFRDGQFRAGVTTWVRAETRVILVGRRARFWLTSFDESGDLSPSAGDMPGHSGVLHYCASYRTLVRFRDGFQSTISRHDADLGRSSVARAGKNDAVVDPPTGG